MTKSRRIRRKRSSALSQQELTIYREQPRFEIAGAIANYVVCRECGGRLQCIVKAHLALHNLTASQYREKWNYPSLYSSAWLKRHNESGFRWREANPDKAKAISERYLNRHRLEVREKAREQRRKKKWELNELFRKRYHEDYKFAERCRKKGRAWYKAHPERQRERSRRKTSEVHELRRIVGHRPPDWNRKPIEWRIIATELITTDYLSNQDLGERLDNCRILTCPYGPCWKHVLSSDKNKVNRAAVNFVSEIRKWVVKPGRSKFKTTIANLKT